MRRHVGFPNVLGDKLPHCVLRDTVTAVCPLNDAAHDMRMAERHQLQALLESCADALWVKPMGANAQEQGHFIRHHWREYTPSMCHRFGLLILHRGPCVPPHFTPRSGTTFSCGL